MVNGWKKIIDREYHQVFAKAGAKIGSGGVVVIDKIPTVEIPSMKTTGHTYSVKSSKKYTKWKNFGSYADALTNAEKRMREF